MYQVQYALLPEQYIASVTNAATCVLGRRSDVKSFMEARDASGASWLLLHCW